ncbi:MAG: hypothetical protein LRY71_03060 [Bacillaceae bacterium]|nr:hypothetical protein [Bacillaceae bacterium]
MYKYMVLFGLILIFLSFWMFVFSLLRILPIFIASPLLLLSILFTVHSINERRRFRGFQ